MAFSAGVDSTALFFLLLKNGIDFDIAIVNYNVRKEAILEVEYAKTLSKRYNKKIFIANAPKFSSNFEANAREFRYSFFKKIIQENGYNSLITAHQLNDKLEWLLMSLNRGSGVSELFGMEKVSYKDGIKIVRPLLDTTKDELLSFLQENKIKYFIDKSNFNLKFKRNQFRPIVDELLKFGKNGYIKSFKILKNEKDYLHSKFKIIYKKDKFAVAKIEDNFILPYAISTILKEFNYLISGKERDIFKSCNSFVVGRKWAVEYVDDILYIAPFVNCKLTKNQKEEFRKLKIPPKIRCYLSKNVDILKGFIC